MIRRFCFPAVSNSRRQKKRIKRMPKESKVEITNLPYKSIIFSLLITLSTSFIILCVFVQKACPFLCVKNRIVLLSPLVDSKTTRNDNKPNLLATFYYE